MKVIYLPILFLLCLFSLTANADSVDGITWLLKQGKTERISQFLSPTVELTIDGQQNTYSKRQTMEVLSKFFSARKPMRVTLLHKVNSNQKFLFGVIIYKTTGSTYRVSLTLNEMGGAMRVIEMRIEPEKTK